MLLARHAISLPLLRARGRKRQDEHRVDHVLRGRLSIDSHLALRLVGLACEACAGPRKGVAKVLLIWHHPSVGRKLQVGGEDCKDLLRNVDQVGHSCATHPRRKRGRHGPNRDGKAVVGGRDVGTWSWSVGHRRHLLDVGKDHFGEAPCRVAGVGVRGDQQEVFDDARVPKAAVSYRVRARRFARVIGEQEVCLWQVARL